LGKLPEYLDNLGRGKLVVNAASLIPNSPLRACAMGKDAARDPKYQAIVFTIRTIPARGCGIYTDAHVMEAAEQMLIRHAQR
jgi:N-acyl-D-aspartate/D-glutamate deacylase